MWLYWWHSSNLFTPSNTTICLFGRTEHYVLTLCLNITLTSSESSWKLTRLLLGLLSGVGQGSSSCSWSAEKRYAVGLWRAKLSLWDKEACCAAWNYQWISQLYLCLLFILRTVMATAIMMASAMPPTLTLITICNHIPSCKTVVSHYTFFFLWHLCGFMHQNQLSLDKYFQTPFIPYN